MKLFCGWLVLGCWVVWFVTVCSLSPLSFFTGFVLGCVFVSGFALGFSCVLKMLGKVGFESVWVELAVDTRFAGGFCAFSCMPWHTPLRPQRQQSCRHRNQEHNNPTENQIETQLQTDFERGNQI